MPLANGGHGGFCSRSEESLDGPPAEAQPSEPATGPMKDPVALNSAVITITSSNYLDCSAAVALWDPGRGW